MKKYMGILLGLFFCLLWAGPAQGAASIEQLSARLDSAGRQVTVSGIITSGAGKEISVKIISPEGDSEILDQITSGAGGIFCNTYGLDNLVAGTYEVTTGSASIAQPVSTTFVYPVTNTAVSIIPLIASADPESGKVLINGIISSGREQQIGLKVLNSAQEIQLVDQISSGEGGYFSYSFMPQNYAPGTYQIQFNAAGIGTAVTTYFDYQAPATAIISSLVASANTENSRVCIRGNISSGPGQEVSIRITAPDSSITVAQITSGANGEFSYEYTENNPRQGTYTVELNSAGINPVSTSFSFEQAAGSPSINQLTVKTNADKSITISGFIGSGAGKEISIRIAKPDTSLEYAYQTTSGENGIFNMSYQMTEVEEGEYLVTVNGPAGTTPATASFSLQPVEGCFIATACFGSYLDPHVYVLRNFRDRVLLTTRGGRWFVSEYYQHSPPIAAYLSVHEGPRILVRLLLTPLVYLIKYAHLSLLLLLALLYKKIA